MRAKDGTDPRQPVIPDDPDAEAPEPLAATYLLTWFWQLSNRRGAGMGIEAISWEAMDAWARRSGNDPEPWEIGMIEAMDNAFVDAVSRGSGNAPEPLPQDADVCARPLSMPLFDALFG